MYGRVRSLHGEIPHFGVDENSMGICLGYSSTLDVHGCARLRYQLIARSCSPRGSSALRNGNLVKELREAVDAHESAGAEEFW